MQAAGPAAEDAMERTGLLDKVSGCLLGGLIGAAMGAAARVKPRLCCS